jgi:hypothetical protein
MTYQHRDHELFEGDETDLIVAIIELRSALAELRSELAKIKARIKGSAFELPDD